MKQLFSPIRLFNKPFILVALLFATWGSARAQICINEIMPGNCSMFLDPTYNYSGWVEFYNQGTTSVRLYNYYLSDDPAQPKKYRITNYNTLIPAKGYMIVWFDHNDLSMDQVNFKLNYDGGTLYLYNTAGSLITSQEYPLQVQNVSYARLTDGGDSWGFCTAPTPEKTNAGSTFAYERCPEPTFNIKGGVYKSSSCSVRLTCPVGYEIRYTTDGTEPTATSSRWSLGSTIAFTKTTVLRARLMGAGYIPGAIVTQTYILTNRDFTLPVTSIVTDPKNLTDNTIGIYCRGTNGKTGKGQSSPVNWNQDWARPANFELLMGNTQLFSQECDIAISGGWTRANALKSLKLNAEKKFNSKNKFDYSFFERKPALKFKSLLLRNGGNDWGNSMMADAFQHVLVEGVLDVEYQAYKPTIHYINGEYYGLINLRERNNQQYVYSNFGYDSDSLDLIEKIAPSEGNYEIHNGSIDALDQLVNKASNSNIPSVYEEVQQLMDIDEFIIYMVAEMYSGNWDWPVNNTKVYRHRNNGKFRWILYDMEGGLSVNYNPFRGESNSIMSSTCDNVHTAVLFRNLLKNDTFKQRFIDYFTLCLGSVYKTDRVTGVIDSVAAMIRPEIPYNKAKWGTTGGFEGSVSNFKSFAKNRPGSLIQIIKNYFSLGDAVSLSISSNVPSAPLYMNDIPVPMGASSGSTFKGKSIRVKAEAPAGYRFERWNVMQQAEVVLSPYGSEWSYYDAASLDGQNWQSPSYNTTTWGKGNAPLGYGKTGIATTLDYGNNSSNKRLTYYMRHNFNLASLNASDQYTLYLTVDDGAIVYINGTEIGRYLMPSGTVTYNTTATTYASGNPDMTSFSVPANVLRSGSNVIAIEVHQNSITSSDIYLDAQIVRSMNDASESYDDPEVTFTANSALNLQAEFVKEDNPEASTPPVRINEVSASNDIYVNEYFKSEDWIELYNPADTAVSIAGLYISREPDNPKQYQIPATPEELTVIPPRGYRILWADKEKDTKQLHLPFKLAAEGGTLRLTRMQEQGGQEAVVWTERLTYTPHSSDHTFGRYPDGSDSLYLMNRISYAAANIYSIYNVSQPNIPSGIEEISEGVGLANSGISLYYNSSNMELIIEMVEEPLHAQQLVVSNLPGQIMAQYTIPAGETSHTISLSSLPEGYHLAVLYTADGKQITFRFVR